MTFGRLERTTGAPPMSDINMTPLIDVMLVLLVIFMITAPLMVSKIKVDLPKVQGTTAAQTPVFVSVSIDKDGRVFLDDQPSDLVKLAQRLQEAATRDSSTEVQLRADSGVPYGRVVEVMGLAHKAGLTRLGFVAASTNGDQPPVPLPR